MGAPSKSGFKLLMNGTTLSTGHCGKAYHKKICLKGSGDGGRQNGRKDTGDVCRQS